MNISELRAFYYDSVVVWLIDISGNVALPYGKPFHKGEFKSCVSYRIKDERLIKGLIECLPFKKDVTIGGCEYWWYESSTEREIEELTYQLLMKNLNSSS